MDYTESGIIFDSKGLSIFGKEGGDLDKAKYSNLEEYDLKGDDESLSYSYTAQYLIADWKAIGGAVAITAAAIVLVVVIVDDAAAPGLLTYIMNYLANAKEVINQFSILA